VLLRLRQFRFAAHALPALLRPAAALGGAGADKISLHVSEAAENGNHQAPGAGAGIGPRFGEPGRCRSSLTPPTDRIGRQAVNLLAPR